MEIFNKYMLQSETYETYSGVEWKDGLENWYFDRFVLPTFDEWHNDLGVYITGGDVNGTIPADGTNYKE